MRTRTGSGNFPSCFLRLTAAAALAFLVFAGTSENAYAGDPGAMAQIAEVIPAESAGEIFANGQAAPYIGAFTAEAWDLLGDAAAFGAVIGGGFSALESYRRGDDAATAAGHIAVGSAIGSAASAAGAVTAAGVGAGLGAAGITAATASPIVVTAVPVLAGVAVAGGVRYGLRQYSGDAERYAAEAAERLIETGSEAGRAVTKKAEETGVLLTEKAEEAGALLTEKAEEAEELLTEKAEQAGEAFDAFTAGLTERGLLFLEGN